MLCVLGLGTRYWRYGHRRLDDRDVMSCHVTVWLSPSLPFPPSHLSQSIDSWLFQCLLVSFILYHIISYLSTSCRVEYLTLPDLISICYRESGRDGGGCDVPRPPASSRLGMLVHAEKSTTIKREIERGWERVTETCPADSEALRRICNYSTTTSPTKKYNTFPLIRSVEKRQNGKGLIPLEYGIVLNLVYSQLFRAAERQEWGALSSYKVKTFSFLTFCVNLFNLKSFF